MPVFIRFSGLFVLERKLIVSNFFILCVMIEVLYIRVTGESGTRKFVYSLTRFCFR